MTMTTGNENQKTLNSKTYITHTCVHPQTHEHTHTWREREREREREHVSELKYFVR